MSWLGTRAILVLSLLTLPALAPSALGEDPDTSPPVIEARGPIDANASGFWGANVAYAVPRWSDDVDGTGFATCAPASGSAFPIGNTSVTCTAVDAAGNAATPTTFLVRITLRGVGTVATEQPTYTLAKALTEGVRGAYTLRTPDGNPLAGVNVTLKIIRQVQFVGFVDSTTVTGVTDANGALAFEPGLQFSLPTPYLLIATPSHPLLVGGSASGRYVVTAN